MRNGMSSAPPRPTASRTYTLLPCSADRPAVYCKSKGPGCQARLCALRLHLGALHPHSLPGRCPGRPVLVLRASGSRKSSLAVHQ